MRGIFEIVRKRFAFSEQELIKYVNTSPYRYKTYKIKKRSGGMREISQPSRDLKVLQRFILDEFLHKNFIYHDCAMAYRQNINIADNAKLHVKNPYLLKMDFNEFFPSICAEDFRLFLLEKGVCDSQAEAVMLGRIFFKRGDRGLVLSIGSPGSPSISNAMLFDFDKIVYDLSVKVGITYTRYSDDLTFTTKEKGVLFELPGAVAKILNELRYPRISINPEKTVFSSRKFNRHITGITISNDGKMSLGHGRKRRLRSTIYSAQHLDNNNLARLRGYLSFVHQIEPELLHKLSKKYPNQMKLINSATCRKKRET